MNSTPYTCVLCGYMTHHKPEMRRHFNRKRPCPKTVNNIEMTEEIQQQILDNRVYHILKEDVSDVSDTPEVSGLKVTLLIAQEKTKQVEIKLKIKKLECSVID